MRLAILLNHGSGPQGTSGPASQIAEACAAAAIEASIIATSGSGLAAAARQALADGHTTLVAGGGDGTVSTVAAIVAAHQATLGVLPLGTLNHFAKDLGIPLDLPSAVRLLASGCVRTIDVGEVNGRTFINNSSLGLYPRLVWEREQEQRRGRKKWAALGLAVLHVWRRYRQVTVTIADDAGQRVVRTPFVFVGNNEYQLEAGTFGRRTRLTDGRLHLCLAPDLRQQETLRFVAAVMLGRLNAVDHFESVLTRELSIDGAHAHSGVSLDGEIVALSPPLRYRIRPRALRVIAPASEGAP